MQVELTEGINRNNIVRLENIHLVILLIKLFKASILLSVENYWYIPQSYGKYS